MSQDKIALENQIRKTVYNHILEYPGVAFTTLQKVYNLNNSTLRYHLKYLERAERIASRIESGKLHFYPNNSTSIASNPTNPKFQIHELSLHQENILNAIKHNPGINQTDLMGKTSLKRHILTYHISKLVELGMVRKKNHEKTVCYEYIPDELLQYEMLKILAIKFLNNEIDEQTFMKLRSRLK
jgi:predicted transcriptional regulator